jgi:uncharacterized damage-inducible protein DinB
MQVIDDSAGDRVAAFRESEQIDNLPAAFEREPACETCFEQPVEKAYHGLRDCFGELSPAGNSALAELVAHVESRFVPFFNRLRATKFKGANSTMSYIEHVQSLYEMNRERTLATLDAIAAMDNPHEVLSWRPGPRRAHIGWQLMHVAVTEEMFATDRLLGTQPGMGDLIDRFRGGSTPDENVPTLDAIRDGLAAAREHLFATFGQFSDDDLESVPVGMQERGWTLRKTLQIICWHEGHHQGQAHLTLNLYKASLD